MRDYQRSRVYAWECEQWWWHTNAELTIHEAHKLASDLLGTFVLVQPGRKRAWASYHARRITLPEWTRTRHMICHETAHLQETDKHDPRFMARFCENLARCGLGTVDGNRRSAIDFGLEVHPL